MQVLSPPCCRQGKLALGSLPTSVGPSAQKSHRNSACTTAIPLCNAGTLRRPTVHGSARRRFRLLAKPHTTDTERSGSCAGTQLPPHGKPIQLRIEGSKDPTVMPSHALPQETSRKCPPASGTQLCLWPAGQWRLS